MPVLAKTTAFTGRPETHIFAGILFDMDGTIIDSTDAIVKHWHKCILFGRTLCTKCIKLTVCRIGKELGIDPAVILQSSHGRRSIDTFQLYDASKANWECEWASFAPCLHIDMRHDNEKPRCQSRWRVDPQRVWARCCRSTWGQKWVDRVSIFIAM